MGLEILFVLLGWFALGLMGYTTYTTVKLQLYPKDIAVGKESEGPTVASAQDARLLFFYAPWCPWSKKAKVQWDAFITEYKRFPTTYGGKRVSLELINGDQHQDMVKSYNIVAYPTFKLVTSDQVLEMTGYPSPDVFKNFLRKSLGREEPATVL